MGSKMTSVCYKTALRSWAGLCLVLAATVAGWALNYQGTYKETGIPYNGLKSMTFRLTSQDGLIEYWNSGAMNVAVSTGAFQAILDLGSTELSWGDITPYLEVSVDGTTLLPRDRIGSVIYARHAMEAETLVAGGGNDGAAILPHNVWVYPLAAVGIGKNEPAGPLHVSTAAKDALFVSTNARVGFGTSSPRERLEVSWGYNGSIKLTGVGSGILYPDGSALYSANMGQARSVYSPSYAVIEADSQHAGTGSILMMTGATIRLFVDKDGYVGINVPKAYHRLEVGGGAVVDSSMTVTGTWLDGAQTVFDVAGSAFIVRADGRVGIGTSDPQSTLQVFGDYIQLPVVNNGPGVPPPSPDCGAVQAGRMVLSTGGEIWVCPGTGNWWAF